MDNEDSSADLAFVDVFASALGAIIALVLILLTMDRSSAELREVKRLQVTVTTNSEDSLELEVDIRCSVEPADPLAKRPENQPIRLLNRPHQAPDESPDQDVLYSRCDYFHGTGNTATVWVSHPMPGKWTMQVLVRGKKDDLINLNARIELDGQVQELSQSAFSLKRGGFNPITSDATGSKEIVLNVPE